MDVHTLVWNTLRQNFIKSSKEYERFDRKTSSFLGKKKLQGKKGLSFEKKNKNLLGKKLFPLKKNEQKGKEQSFPSPQDCHQGLLIVYLSVAFSQRERERNC